jgi:UDP-3-O-[3-hydroxymyristoyl] glucosamine N-acyltransferase
MQVTLGELIAQLGGELGRTGVGDADLCFSRIAPLALAGPEAISFLSHPRFAPQLATSRAACVIVPPEVFEQAVARGASIVTDDPYLYFARLTQWWARRTREPAVAGVHRLAAVEEGARVHPGASIGPFAVVERGACVGDGAVLGAHVTVGRDATIGANTTLRARVTLAEGCRIGERGLVHSGAVIGADGFGFAPHGGQWVKIEQLGGVRIGDDVEIGANTCIDRGALEDTVLGDGVKLDNLIQIGHNVAIGNHCAFAGCVGVAGSATIGARCTAGGGAMILGHLELCDDVHLTAATVVSRSIRKPGLYSGSFPFDDNASWEKNAATLRQLHALRERVRALEKKP